MSVIITWEEIQLLALMNGATGLFGFQSGNLLQKERVPETLLRLIERGLVTPTGNGFCCTAAATAPLDNMLHAAHYLLLTNVPRELPQLCCYCKGEGLTVLEPIREQKNGFKLYTIALNELVELLGEDGYLPEPTPEADCSGVSFELLNSMSDPVLQDDTSLLFLAKRTDHSGGKESSAAIVLRGKEALLLTATDEDQKACGFTLDRLKQWMKGEF